MARERFDPLMRAWVRRDPLKGPFEIDALVRELRRGASPGLMTFWKDREGWDTGLARQGIDIAIIKAGWERHDLDREDRLNDWGRIADRSSVAHEALDDLIKLLTAGGDATQQDLRPALTSPQFFPGSASERAMAVGDAAQALWRARETAALIAEVSEREFRSTKSAPNGPKNDYKAFCAEIGVAWAHLTGERPKHSRESSPFQIYLMQAWKDAGGTFTGGSSDDATESIFFNGAKHAHDFVSEARLARIRDNPMSPDDWPGFPRIPT